jgi:hypothetical protein
VDMGPKSSVPSADLATTGKPMVDYLMAQHGLSPIASAALIGNLGWESPGFNTSQRHDGGRGFGLAGWDPSRTAGLQAFAAAQKKPITDPQVQIDYAVHEMKSGTDMGAARAWAMLQGATTPEQANAAIMHFFRPQGYTPANPTGGHGFSGRVANTRALLPQGRPVDPASAPVPSVTPDPDEAPPPPSVPPWLMPRPGLGPRAMPGPAPAPADGGVPVAQGGGEGEVVLPRIGLPFPARPAVAAAPGSVPFPAMTQPAPAPAAQPAPGGIDLMPPPPPVLPTKPALSREDSVRLQTMALSGNEAQAQSEYNRILQMQRGELTDRHKADMEVWKQKIEDRKWSRGQTATLETEQRRADAEQQRHERDAAERQKAREDASKQADNKLTFEQTKFMADNENKMRDDFNGIKQVQDFRKADLVFQSAQKAAKTDSAAADLHLVYSFATIMDPGSVVRDQETGMIIATQNASDRIKAMVTAVTGGSRLSPESKKALIAEMGSRHAGYKESHDAFATAFEDMAKRRGLDPLNVVSRVVLEKAKEEKKDDTIIDVLPSGKRK